MTEKKILIIGLVWPEPCSSAAGTRMLQLIDFFIAEGDQVIFACAASKTEYSFDLRQKGVTEREIELNDDGFNIFLQEIAPDMVLFDRFVMEEQYGWRVQQECPDALRILDTEDLHCLRHARQMAVKTGQAFQTSDLFTDMAKREIAAILRCDLSLIISEVEMKILTETFHLDPSLIYYLPFLEENLEETDLQNWKSYEERAGFMFIGNYLHEPNWHTLQTLKTKIWPVLRKKLPGVQLHIYGAYSNQKVMQLHNEKERFLVHGRAADAKAAISQHRVLLAPIQFGAGLKGKFIDTMLTGTPNVTTTIGAEAMSGGLDWNGAIVDDPELFIAAAVTLYQMKDKWLQAQQNGIRILHTRYNSASFLTTFEETLKNLSQNLKTHRQRNFFGQILQYHNANSTKYMSLWITEKKRHRP
ncbi:glycosyltransferase family 4 protein [Pedobacter sp. PLR]|uniref:glycosyltransferase n=1 Tax=Pedobacter sp. PLR TaxID=2994465 RepID=UPI0022451A40|nr:glycosyltransferase family 4 protein [Pedobacter sp. PLR]MCX2452116.1 glycosyltransferase family 4 protein [Pedobacter sp. PLR]